MTLTPLIVAMFALAPPKLDNDTASLAHSTIPSKEKLPQSPPAWKL